MNMDIVDVYVIKKNSQNLIEVQQPNVCLRLAESNFRNSRNSALRHSWNTTQQTWIYSVSDSTNESVSADSCRDFEWYDDDLPIVRVMGVQLYRYEPLLRRNNLVKLLNKIGCCYRSGSGRSAKRLLVRHFMCACAMRTCR